MSTALLDALPKRRERHFDDRVTWCFRDRMASVWAGFAQAARAHANAVALSFGSQQWRYSELEAEIGRVATGLQSLDVGAGDRVTMLVRNRAEFVVAFYAIQRIGAIAVPMDVRLQGAEVGHVLADSGARLLLHDAEMADRLPAALGVAPDVVCVALPEEGDGPLFPDAVVSAAPFEGGAEEDIAMILYTSGTTGKPKGAAIAHLNVAHSVIHHAGNLGLDQNDSSVIAVPLSHVTGLLCGVIAPLWTGGRLTVLPRFKAQEFLAAATAARMTYTIMVPAMYNLCVRVEDAGRHDLSCWRLGHFGGSPMPEATIAAVARQWPGLTLVNGYGSTETCSPAIMMPVDDAAVHKPPASSGKPLACVEILVVDPETCVEMPVGQDGELWLRGPMVIASYWNDPAATAKGIVAGFWRSGDIGCVDAEGFVYVRDRLKDLINRGGYKIYSAEVEAVLSHCPGVLEAAIVGKPDPVLGERVHAFVSVTSQLTEEALEAFCAERLGDYKVPESWTLSTDPLPRNATGKLSKKDLRALLLAH